MSERLVAMTFEEASRWIAAQDKRIAQLEAFVLEAHGWIEEDTEALEASHKPYDLDNPIDVEVAKEVDDRRTWLTRTTAETACDHVWVGTGDDRVVCDECGTVKIKGDQM